MENAVFEEALWNFALEIVYSHCELSLPLINLLLMVKQGTNERKAFDESVVLRAKEENLVREEDGILQITQEGKDQLQALDESKSSLDDECIEWIDWVNEHHSEINCKPIGNSQEQYRKFIQWIDELDKSKIDRIFDPRFLEQQWISPVKHIWQAIKCHQLQYSGPCALLRRFFLDFICSSLIELQQRGVFSENIENKNVYILVDTNVLLDLSTPQRLLHTLAQETWKNLKHYVNNGSLKLCVSTRTLSELRDVITKASDNVWRLHIKKLSGIKVNEADLLDLHSLEKQFLTAKTGTTFADLADSKIAEILNFSSLSQQLRGWSKIRVIDDCFDKDALIESIKIIEEKDCDLVEERSLYQNMHDVALVLLAADRNIRSERERWVVWTHHFKLVGFTRALDLDKTTVAHGANIALMIKGMSKDFEANIEDIRELYREFMIARYRSEDIPELTEFINILTRRWTSMGMQEPQFESENTEISTSLAGDENSLKYEEERWTELLSGSSRRSRAVMIPESFIQDSALENWVDVTMDFGASSGGHGVEPPAIERQDDSNAPIWHISLHSVSHCDLPWAIKFERELELDKSGVSRFDDYRDTRLPSRLYIEAQPYRRQLIKTRTEDAVIVNFTHLQDRINGSISNGYDSIRRINQNITAQELANLISDLAIDESTIRSQIGDMDRLAGRVLVLHTGWAASYLPKDISSLPESWEAGHPWLVHPWVTENAAKTILMNNVTAIATDCPMIDCPIYIIKNVATNEVVKDASDILFNEKVFDKIDGHNGFTLPDLQPLHTRGLLKGIMLYENLHIPNEVCWYKSDASSFETQMLFSFLDFPLLMDSALCKIYIQNPEVL